MGADHTAGLVVDPGQPIEDIAQASQEAQILNTVIDTSGFCQFLMPSIEEMTAWFRHFYGENITREEVADIGWQCMEEEWEFNRRAGFGPEDDEMPDTMKQDAIGPAKSVWDIPQDVVNQAYTRFEPREELFTQKPS
jgi:aldehyde:ferredoxin oxidoreductase